jgi:hypothetical protein
MGMVYIVISPILDFSEKEAQTDRPQAMGSDAFGWLHQGMAIRLALDMGLNMDPSVLSGAVALPPIEIELRRQIYWALYCHDKLSASYTGRVCTLLVCYCVSILSLFTVLTFCFLSARIPKEWSISHSLYVPRMSICPRQLVMDN